MNELKEGVPSIEHICNTCGKEALYSYREVTDEGEIICRHCQTLQWAASLLVFKRTINAESKQVEAAGGNDETE